MTRQQAVKRLGKVFGKKAAYRVTDGAPNAADREKAQAATRELNALRSELEARQTSLRLKLLDVPEYRELTEHIADVKKQQSALTGIMLSYKFTAGYLGMGFFHVEAQGDTWEEVFDKLTKKGHAA